MSEDTIKKVQDGIEELKEKIENLESEKEELEGQIEELEEEIENNNLFDKSLELLGVDQDDFLDEIKRLLAIDKFCLESGIPDSLSVAQELELRDKIRSIAW